jgi:hypothetical protein
MRISNSFSEGEVQVLDFIISTLLRGGSPAMATRNKDFASLCRKVVAMRHKVAEKKRKEILKARPQQAETVPAEAIEAEAVRPEPEAPAESSVGVIEAASAEEAGDLEQTG